MNSSSKISMVGKEALSYCSSCRMDLNHTIVAMQGDRIRKVQCRTCKKEHMYKAPKGVNDPAVQPAEKPEKAARTKTAAAAKSTPIEVEWHKQMLANSSPIKPYSAKGSFSIGDKLNHPMFGDGIVGKLVFPNKIEVVFRHDLKVLIHAGAQTY